ncbi:superoxide dismutase family protein [Thermoactinospora rubra]|uniref:superoxide dismutase family protein n=1 Tax=Thermoactinospora rubra TaxID=1088767 RepID=UPI00117C6554|nr:superoxide dismutase family protein [Thermoactinospora rubra]
MRLPVLVFVLLATGCSGPSGAHHTQPSQPIQPIRLTGSGDLMVYDSKLAPEGARLSATVDSSDTGTISSLTVEGFVPGRAYGAHLHAKRCGAKPDDSGPHYQHDPGHVDANSEVWLDFTTDSSGAARSTARHTWKLGADRLPGSVVVHAKTTKRDGTAGPRVACLTLAKA